MGMNGKFEDEIQEPIHNGRGKVEKSIRVLISFVQRVNTI